MGEPAVVELRNISKHFGEGAARVDEASLSLEDIFLLAASRLGVEAAAYYSTSPLAATLADLVDFKLINGGGPRLTVGAANVQTAEMLDLPEVGANRLLPEALDASARVRDVQERDLDRPFGDRHPLQHTDAAVDDILKGVRKAEVEQKLHTAETKIAKNSKAGGH